MKKAFPIATFIFSAICLFNPVIAGIDFLPDVFGFGFMLLSLYSLTVVKYTFEELFNRYKLLFFLSIAQVFAVIFINTSLKNQSANVYEQPTMVLVEVFVYAVLEVLFLLPCLKETLKVMEEISNVSNGKLENLTTFFVWTQAICMVIPETLVLTQFSYEAENPLFPFSWYPYTNMFRVVFGSISFTVGLIWLIKVIKFYKKCAKSEKILSFQTSKTDEELNKKRRNILRYNTSFLLLFIALIFCLNLHFEEINYLPNLFVAIFVFAYFVVMKKEIGTKVWHYLICFLLLALSVAQNIFYGNYLKEYIPEASLYKPDAYTAYLPIRLLSFSERIVTAVLVLLAIYKLFVFLKKTSKIEYKDNIELSERATNKLIKSYKKRLIATAIVLGIGITLSAFDGLFHLYADWIRFTSEAVMIVGIILYSLLIFELKDNNKADFVQYQT